MCLCVCVSVCLDESGVCVCVSLCLCVWMSPVCLCVSMCVSACMGEVGGGPQWGSCSCVWGVVAHDDESDVCVCVYD